MSEFSQNLAVVIGIDHYGSGIAPLQTAVNDVQELARILKDDHGYTVVQLVDEKATLKRLQHLLDEELPKLTQADGRLLFYFAGHGIALNGEEGPEGYLIPQDAKLGDISSYLSMPKLQAALSGLPCRHFLGIFDCCFAGAFRWSSTRDLLSVPEVIHKERYDRFIQDPAWQAITSAAYDQRALDSLNLNTDRGQTGNHSPFADALIEALAGKADAYPPAQDGKPAGDGVITATELYLYLRDRVEPAIEGQRQTPGIWPLKKHNKGEYVFLSPGHALNLPPAPPLDESRNPYRGLESFDEAQRDLFFGRQALTEKLSEFVSQQPLAVVLGASGSGKSSLVKAGLIPNLKQLETKENQRQWQILTPMRPGESPFKALSNTLDQEKVAGFSIPELGSESKVEMLTQYMAAWSRKNPDIKLLLAIDQFEELITLCRDDKEREKFLKGLAQAVAAYPEQLRLVLTLRSDFEPQFQDAALKDHWSAARFVVPPMTRVDLREAIEEPASKRVMYFQSDDPKNPLVDQFINEVAEMPGALPLLSFTLSELYLKYLKRQKIAQDRGDTIDRAITEADYKALGGVARSLTQRADQEYEVLVQQDPAYEQTIRHVMLRMVAVGGGELARRRVPSFEFKYPPAQNERVEEVIRRFSVARLIVEGQDPDGKPYVEPAHDALVRGWKRLLEWKKEEEESLILQRRLTPAAEEWKDVDENKQSQGFLAKAEPVIDGLDRGLYMIEKLLNKTGAQFVQLWKRSQQQQERSREQPGLFLWITNPYLDVLNEQLKSKDNWFNQVETEFVQKSVLQRRQNTSWRWRIVFTVILGLSGLTIAALIQWRNSELNQANSLGRYSLSLLAGEKGLDVLLEAIKAGKILQKQNATDSVVTEALLQAIPGVSEHDRMEGHDGSVNTVSFSPDGKTLATGSADRTIKLWNLETGKEIRTLQGHGDSVDSVSFSPDGKTLATGSADKTIKLWNLEMGKEIRTLKGHENTVMSVSFSPDGKTLATGSADQTIKLWNLETGKEIRTLKGHHDLVHSVSFSPDGKTLATGSDDQTIKLWNLETGKEIPTHMEHSDSVETVSFSPNGKTLATGSDDQTIKLWNLETGKEIPTHMEHSDLVETVSFSPDGKTLATGSADQTIKLWNLETGKEIHTLKGHTGWVMSVSFSPDGKTLATGSNDTTIKLWNLETGREIHTLKGHKGRVMSVSFSSDGKTLATGSADRTIKLWNLETGKDIHTLNGHTDSVNSVSFSPDSKTLATGSADRTIKLWNLETGKDIRTLQGHDNTVWSVSFSPDGKTLATGSADRTIKLWNLETGKEIRTLQGHGDSVDSVSFSPNGKTLATSSDDKTIKLWNLETGKEIRTLQGHTNWVISVSFSPDGKTLATGSADRTIKLWNLETGKEIHTLQGHENTVMSVSFSPDGKTLATGSADQTIKLWNLETGKEIHTLNGHTDSVNSVSFSPDGKTLATGSADQTIKLWNLDFWNLGLESLMGRGCDWVRTYLQNNPNVDKSDRHLCDDISSHK